ncbi:Succinylglutamate desuccinylase [Vibrio mediterranei]|uniref:Succinylglutamate desuccinylase n=1 Tax=Vibrio mediterranei TaxID=689 RepID=A0AAJ3QQ57_9VIBR|nr:succinylglutamate desuccinylase [Vibrio mediterranei]ASI90679.1 succinylglutamate desuccinylase [Vibrio mediterranei]MCG9664916.1 succinylglutamate desuccinylase [Vibrio mediterranei]NOH26936.1 succinylglutamate desuccinylase [Vibrio mediterranei]PCD89770.1 succinylglutamate desuccinylase [Vibrio mediterranei]PRQ69159.1 succinylglutamate desuccinylase [Vibrio mediterranei]
MTKSLFRQSFLKDTLETETEFTAKSLNTPDGVKMELSYRGVLEVTPKHLDKDSKHIIISCGIHGDETAPMELVSKMVEDIESGFLKLNARCLFIIAHPEATNRHTRFIDENLNRLFGSKEHAVNREVAIAKHLRLLVDKFYQGTEEVSRWHLDLHCAIRESKHYSFVVSPRSRHAVRSKALFDYVASAHMDAVLLSNAPSSTFSWFSAENYGAQALTMELGRVARIGENDLEKLLAFDIATRDLLSEETPEHLAKQPVIYRVSRTVVRHHDDFGFLFDDDVENFTEFKHGEVFGHDGDKPLMAKNDHEAIVFPNRKVVVGQRAALMVVKVATRYEDDQLVYD